MQELISQVFDVALAPFVADSLLVDLPFAFDFYLGLFMMVIHTFQNWSLEWPQNRDCRLRSVENLHPHEI